MAYTTRSNVEAYLRTTFDATTTPSSTIVDEWVADSTTEVINLTGTVWSPTSGTEYFDLSATTDRVLVSNYPLISVQSLAYNEGTEWEPVWTDFDYYRNIGDIIKFSIPQVGPNKIRAVYTYGYTSVPPEVEFLATLLVAQKIASSDDSANNDSNAVSIGPISLSVNTGISRMINIDKRINEQLRKIGKYKTLLRTM